MNDRLKVLSLFTGAMGLDLGLRATGHFNVVACVEKEAVFCDTIRANIECGNLPENPWVYESDIQKLDPFQVMAQLAIQPGEIDVLVGGPPCQSFSTAGRRGTVRDPRGTLLWDFLRFVKALKPKVFLMENVRGLMSAAMNHRPIADRPDKGGPALQPEEEAGSVIHLFARDLESFEDAPYRMDCFEVNAVNYGAPQLRERVLFVGNRFNREVSFPNPTHGSVSPGPRQLPLFESGDRDFLPWMTLGDVIKGLFETHPVIMDFSPRKKKYLSLVPPGGNWRHLPEDLQKESMGKAFYAKGGRSGWWRRLTYDLPCPTLVTMPNHASTALCHPEEVRALTVREYLRIQEFPDEWVVCGNPAQQYAQIGNAVPVRLGQVVGQVIASFLQELAVQGWKAVAGPIRPYRRIYIQSHVRTRQWYKNGQVFQWNDGEENLDVMYASPKTKRYSTALEERSPCGTK
jgi:DNA (cytosine-5)-methyltransferase 1